MLAVKKLHSHKISHGLHSGHDFMHLVYFIGVAVEGHGLYPIAAGILFIISVSNYFIVDDNPHVSS